MFRYSTRTLLLAVLSISLLLIVFARFNREEFTWYETGGNRSDDGFLWCFVYRDEKPRVFFIDYSDQAAGNKADWFDVSVIAPMKVRINKPTIRPFVFKESEVGVYIKYNEEPPRLFRIVLDDPLLERLPSGHIQEPDRVLKAILELARSD